ncbi:MAG: GyrI-like domain-containing protein [Deltaproteobacteria bacterium]|nr:GyrI-like domain-containing protein [Deltaproteobacteria bacterium]
MTAIVQIDAVETLRKRRLVGFCSILDSRNVEMYYDLLWYKFLERISHNDLVAHRNLYGVCARLNNNSGFFEYWTAVETYEGDQLADDLVPIDLSAGLYGSRVEKPEKNLAKVYSQLISGWKTPSDYILNWNQPFFEVFQPNWFNREAVKISVPLYVSSATSNWLVSLPSESPSMGQPVGTDR